MSSCGDGSSPLCICYNDPKYMSSITSLSYSQKYENTLGWDMFNRVERWNSNVSTLHSQGDSNAVYWKFASSEDISYYKNGALLHVQYLGYSTIVQKN